MTSVPLSMKPSDSPVTVRNGPAALRRAWRCTIAPLGHALGPRGADVVLLQHLEQARSGSAGRSGPAARAARDQPAGSGAAGCPSRTPGRSPPSADREHAGSASAPARSSASTAEIASRAAQVIERAACDAWPPPRRAGSRAAVASTMAASASSAVAGQRCSSTIGSAGRRCWMERPKSPRGTAVMKSRYCACEAAGRGRAACRAWAISSSVAVWSTRNAAGSPVSLRMKKTDSDHAPDDEDRVDQPPREEPGHGAPVISSRRRRGSPCSAPASA